MKGILLSLRGGAAAGAILACCLAPAETANLNPVADSSIYENTPDGNAGAHVGLFAGRSGVSTTSRSVLRFDLSSIPMGSVVTNATLTMTVERGTGSPTQSVHRLLASWVEGTGDALGVGGGQGSNPVAGAVSWNSREHGSVLWTAPGGDSVATASATVSPAPAVGSAVWSGSGLIADVQAWVDDPSSNFGWLLKNDVETGSSSVRRYDSREATAPPLLTVDYNPPASVDAWMLY